MSLSTLMQNKNISKYRLSKNSGIPYTTLADILNGKARLEKCSAETVYKLAKELNISMEELLAPCFIKRSSFDLFKSNVCHRVKELGDVSFIIELLEKDDIQTYYERQWYPEAFYLLAMLDYLSRINQIPLCEEYAALRRQKLSEPIYPSSIVAASLVSDNNNAKQKALRSAIPEFLHFNIVESEVRNVI